MELCLAGTVLRHLLGVEGGCFGDGELLAESGDGDVSIVEGRLIGGGGGGVHGGAGREEGSLCAVASLVVGFSLFSLVCGWLICRCWLAGVNAKGSWGRVNVFATRTGEVDVRGYCGLFCM